MDCAASVEKGHCRRSLRLKKPCAAGRPLSYTLDLYCETAAKFRYLSQIYFVTEQSPQPVGTQHPSIVPYSRVSAALKWTGLASAREAAAIPAYWLRRRYEVGTVSMVAALALLLFDIKP